ncbi:MAG: hypothetical protein Q9187_000895 [Circinaria calcarea]
MAVPPSSTVGPEASAEYSGDKLIIFTAIFIPVQIFCVALRYFVRYLIKGQWGLDDIVVLISLLLQLCMAGISIGSVKRAGVGYHTTYLEAQAPEKVTRWGKYLVAISTLYFGGINIPKLAILAFYRRLFSKKRIRLAIHLLAGCLIALTLSTVVTAFVACIPYAANWDPNIPGAVCINKEAFFIWGSIPNILSDIIMLILPMPVVWKLHTSTRLKIGLTITFAVGSLGLITSIVRFTTFFHKNSFVDGTWSAVDLIIWTQIEAGIYLISACLPTYRPLLERIGTGRWTFIPTTPEGNKDQRSDSLKRTNSAIPLTSPSKTHKMGIRGQEFRRPQNNIETTKHILVTTDIYSGETFVKEGGSSGVATKAVAERNECAGRGQIVIGKNEWYGTKGDLATYSGAKGRQKLITYPVACIAGGAQGVKKSGADCDQGTTNPHKWDVIANECDQTSAYHWRDKKCHKIRQGADTRFSCGVAKNRLKIKGKIVNMHADSHGYEDCEGTTGGGGTLGNNASRDSRSGRGD